MAKAAFKNKKNILIRKMDLNLGKKLIKCCGSGSSVGIVTDYGLDCPGSNPGWDEIFTRPDHPGAHTASCKMCTGSSPGVKCCRGVLLTTHPLLVPRSWKCRAILLPTHWATPDL